MAPTLFSKACFVQPPLFGPSTSSHSDSYIYTKKYIPPYEKPYNHHAEALWSVASSVHHSCQAIQYTVQKRL